MMRHFLVCGLLLTGLSISASAEDKHLHLPTSPTNVGLEKMKTLVGTWVAPDKDGKPTDDVVSVIKLTAGGSVIHRPCSPDSLIRDFRNLRDFGSLLNQTDPRPDLDGRLVLFLADFDEVC